jgi:hypothetical protein
MSSGLLPGQGHRFKIKSRLAEPATGNGEKADGPYRLILKNGHQMTFAGVGR